MNDDQLKASVKILVADDQIEVRSIVQSVLASMGFLNIYLASTGSDAIEVAIKRAVDIVICDWNMPMANGLEVLTALRSHPDHKNTPFLMLTSESYRENVRQAAKAGVTAYLIKPITTSILKEQLENVLKDLKGVS